MRVKEETDKYVSLSWSQPPALENTLAGYVTGMYIDKGAVSQPPALENTLAGAKMAFGMKNKLLQEKKICSGGEKKRKKPEKSTLSYWNHETFARFATMSRNSEG